MQRGTISDNGLSFLCEDLIFHVMGKLSRDSCIVEAARLGLVSKYFQHCWYSIPTLLFDINRFEQRDYHGLDFINFVNRTILQHNESVVETLIFELPMGTEALQQIRQEWMSFGVASSVQKLKLVCRLSMSLPNGLFLSKTLVELKLYLLNYNVRWEDRYSLPNLKRLKVKHVVLNDNTFSSRLGKWCPELNDLQLLNYDFRGLTEFEVYLPCVKIFKMVFNRGQANVNIKVDFPDVDVLVMLLKQDQQGLGHLQVVGTLPRSLQWIVHCHGYYIGSFCSRNRLLQEVVKMTKELLYNEQARVPIDFVKMLVRVESLRCIMAKHFFINMYRLEIRCSKQLDNLAVTLVLISRCTILNELKVDLEDAPWENNCTSVFNYVKDWKLQAMGLELLNEVTIFNFSGSDCKLNYIRYVLSHATELGTLNIYCTMSFFDDPIDVHKRPSIRAYEGTASKMCCFVS